MGEATVLNAAQLLSDIPSIDETFPMSRAASESLSPRLCFQFECSMSGPTHA